MSREKIFCIDVRLMWRVCWLVGGGFVLASMFMYKQGAPLLFLALFAVLGSILFLLGSIAPIFLYGRPVVALNDKGMKIFKGTFGGGDNFVIPWDSIESVKYTWVVSKSRNQHQKQNGSFNLVFKLTEMPTGITKMGQFIADREKNVIMLGNPPVGGYNKLILGMGAYNDRFIKYAVASHTFFQSVKLNLLAMFDFILLFAMPFALYFVASGKFNILFSQYLK